MAIVTLQPSARQEGPKNKVKVRLCDPPQVVSKALFGLLVSFVVSYYVHSDNHESDSGKRGV